MSRHADAASPAGGETRPDQPSPPARRLTARRFARGSSRALFLATLAAFTASLFARRHWLPDDLTSFRPQYAAAAVACIFAFLCLRQFRSAAASAVLAGLLLVGFRPASVPEPTRDAPTFRLVSANVRSSNRSFGRFLDFIRAERPDAVLVLEVSPEWAQILEDLRDEFPHSLVLPRRDNFGIALLSRLPAEIDVAEFGDSGLPSIVARVTHDGRSLTVLGTHPWPPVGAATARGRDRQLAAVAAAARNAEGEVVVAGDLNLSPWSPYFGDLLRDGRLSDTRSGLAPQASWPTFFPPLSTPIDHVLVSEGLSASDRRLGPHIGSDHRPVVADLSFRN